MSADPGPAELLARRIADPVSAGAVVRLGVGRHTVIGVSDGYLLMSPTFVGAPDAPTGAYDLLAAQYGEVRLPVGCFVVPAEKNVLIDTGIGPVDHQGRGRLVGGNLLPALAAQGFAPSDIGVVALSHLHGDHAGTIGDPRTGMPVFGEARTVIGEGDWDYFVTRRGGVVPLPEHTLHALHELDRRGLVELVDGDVDVTPAIRRIHAPGHTPGHSLYSVHDGAVRLVLLGDAAHCPQQLTETDWSVAFDVDPALARRTRDTLVRDLDAHGGGALGCHFPELRLARALR
ncbi:MAG TPA: MBL fold metallo-hydrolase [Ilumatobacter sp.]|nr:MBL fold metallo-hydrolase [Ilumatobacter sp.]